MPSAVVNGDFIQLTPDQTSKIGGVKLNETINLKSCNNWQVEFDFRMDGAGTYAHGDGIAFWYLANPPAAYVVGGGLGIPDNAEGLMIAFDTYNNSNDKEMSKVHVLYGTNSGNIEFNNTAGSTFHSADLKNTLHFVGPNYRHVKVSASVDPAIPANWIIKIEIDNTLIVNQSFTPSGGALNMSHGYFGFSSSTGAATSRQSIKNVKVYSEKLPLLKTTLTPDVCINSATGNSSIDLTAYNSQFINNPGNYIFTYFVNGSGTPIANPSNFQYTGNTTIHVFVKDPASTLCDGNAIIQLNPAPFTTNNATLTGCNNNKAGTATFNLNSANVTNTLGATKKYYKTLNDLNSGTNEILSPDTYLSAPGTVYVKVTTPQGCTDTSKITLAFYPETLVNEATIQSCFIENNVLNGVFNLTTANITSLTTGVIKKYYTTITNAINDINEITDIYLYTSTSSAVYAKVIDTNGCFAIAKINLVVLPPIKSTILKDKTICIENKTDLDAGTGFDEYLWSTGAKTPAIKDVSVGTYWVKLRTGNCTTTQIVNVQPSPNPVIASIDIHNNTIVVNVVGGKTPYQYSLDGTHWQASNTFTGLARGEVKVFVKDFYNCSPIEVQITVPNLINAITPNGDNKNDFIDYSALAYKKNLIFTVYDRYGNKLYEANKIRNYTWDGRAYGKKIPSATYWYTISWNENNKNSTETKYSGWVLVKNME